MDGYYDSAERPEHAWLPNATKEVWICVHCGWQSTRDRRHLPNGPCPARVQSLAEGGPQAVVYPKGMGTRG